MKIVVYATKTLNNRSSNMFLNKDLFSIAFSLLSDDSPDNSRTEQLDFYIRTFFHEMEETKFVYENWKAFTLYKTGSESRDRNNIFRDVNTMLGNFLNPLRIEVETLDGIGLRDIIKHDIGFDTTITLFEDVNYHVDNIIRLIGSKSAKEGYDREHLLDEIVDIRKCDELSLTINPGRLSLNAMIDLAIDFTRTLPMMKGSQLLELYELLSGLLFGNYLEVDDLDLDFLIEMAERVQ